MASLNGMQIWRLDIKFNYALLQKAGANTAIKKILNRSLGRDAALSFPHHPVPFSLPRSLSLFLYQSLQAYSAGFLSGK